MERLKFTPAFIQTRNVRNFAVMMDGLALGEGEGRLGKVSGRAGLGKTRTVQTYAAHHDCVYLRVIGPMLDSETEFLERLCINMDIYGIPRRRGAMFYAITDSLTAGPRSVFLDEIERVRPKTIDLVRDLADISGTAFVLIGEDELTTVMRNNDRIWSRTFQSVEFEPVGPADIIYYFMECTGLELDAENSNLIHSLSGGDLRLIKSAALALVQQINAAGKSRISRRMIRNAFKISLRGRVNGSA